MIARHFTHHLTTLQQVQIHPSKFKEHAFEDQKKRRNQSEPGSASDALLRISMSTHACIAGGVTIDIIMLGVEENKYVIPQVNEAVGRLSLTQS